MSRLFSINGYFKDDRSEFNIIVSDSDDFNKDGNTEVLNLGLDEQDIKELIEDGENNKDFDFVLTKYSIIN